MCLVQCGMKCKKSVASEKRKRKKKACVLRNPSDSENSWASQNPVDQWLQWREGFPERDPGHFRTLGSSRGLETRQDLPDGDS